MTDAEEVAQLRAELADRKLQYTTWTARLQRRIRYQRREVDRLLDLYLDMCSLQKQTQHALARSVKEVTGDNRAAAAMYSGARDEMLRSLIKSPRDAAAVHLFEQIAGVLRAFGDVPRADYGYQQIDQAVETLRKIVLLVGEMPEPLP